VEKSIQKLNYIISKSKRLVAFTGAGLSAESGISTYRGAGGLWSKYDPNIYANIEIFMQDSTYYWNFFKEERYKTIKQSRPNKAHNFLAKLEKDGKLLCVITQNIDGLHQLSGQKKVIELHGNTRTIVCLRCKKTYTMEKIYKKLESQLPPTCKCGGKLKPATVLFGEQLPQDALKEAQLITQSCDVFLVLGSSLIVFPAAQLPVIAKQNNAKLAIINIDPTPLDDIADIVINEKASKILSKITNK
jgi:NAD-dependent deacetylase